MTDPRPVYRCDKVTMKILNTYPSVTDAIKTTGYKGIYTSCQHRRVSSGRYVWRFVDDYDPNESFEGKHNRPVMCEDVKNNTTIIYDTLTKAEKALYLDRSVIENTLRKGSLTLGQYRFRYAR